MTRRFSLSMIAAAAIAGAALYSPVQAQSTLRIAMTASDIPATVGQPDQGFEGNRFTGLTMYDALVMWDLSDPTKSTALIPGLATSWKVDDADKTKWIFTLRPGVKFHDGSDFDADAVVWNVNKVLDKNAPHFDARQVGVTLSRMPTLSGVRKIDAMTVEFTTNQPDSFLPINLTNLFMASPAQWEKVGKSWANFAGQASGTGPWKMTRFVPRERLELVRNTDYWNKDRVPKTERMVLLPIPEATARTAALLSGQVDWIEEPSPDALAQLKSRGMQIVTNSTPHTWPWQFSLVEGSPFADVRVRKAANLAIDREGLKKLLSDTMVPAVGSVSPTSPWWGNPSFQIKYDPEGAKKLLAEAGFSKAKPVTVKIQISASGSGQMQPLPMNEFIQQSLAEVGIKVDFDVVDWNTLFTNWRRGAKDPSANGAHATNVSFATMDPFFAFVRFVDSKMVAPTSNNWGWVQTPEFDSLVATARTTFEPAARDAALAKLHAKIVDDALFLFVAHSASPRAMTAKVKGYKQAQSWFQDFSPISMD